MKPELTGYIRQFLPHVQVFLPSEKEIQSLLGSDTDLLDAARTLTKWGAEIVVIKRGGRGLLMYDHKEKKSFQLKAITTSETVELSMLREPAMPFAAVLW
jgi:sugar/nucleoside kinase (ribokinase family)